LPNREKHIVVKTGSTNWKNIRVVVPFKKKMRLVKTRRIFSWVSLPLVAPPFGISMLGVGKAAPAQFSAAGAATNLRRKRAAGQKGPWVLLKKNRKQP